MLCRLAARLLFDSSTVQNEMTRLAVCHLAIVFMLGVVAWCKLTRYIPYGKVRRAFEIGFGCLDETFVSRIPYQTGCLGLSYSLRWSIQWMYCYLPRWVGWVRVAVQAIRHQLYLAPLIALWLLSRPSLKTSLVARVCLLVLSYTTCKDLRRMDSHSILAST